MRIRLEIEKHGRPLFSGTYNVSDAESFGAAFADVFDKLREQRIAKASNIGEVLEEINSYAIDDLQDARIVVRKVDT